MASLEEVFNGNFGKKKDKKKFVSEPQVQVYHIPPIPTSTNPKFIDHVVPNPTVDFVPPDLDEHRPIVSEEFNYANLSKEELLIIIQADKFLKEKPAPKTIFHEHMRVQQSINEYTTEETPPVNVPKVKQKIKWREYGGWWLSIGLSTIVILLLITLLGR